MLIKHWAGEEAAVVFSPRSTQTHLVSAAAGELLTLALAAPVTEVQLVDAFGASPDTEGQLTALLDGLVAAGLLRRSP